MLLAPSGRELKRPSGKQPFPTTSGSRPGPQESTRRLLRRDAGSPRTGQRRGDHEHRWARLSRHALAVLPCPDGREATSPRRNRRAPVRGQTPRISPSPPRPRRRQNAACAAPPCALRYRQSRAPAPATTNGSNSRAGSHRASRRDGRGEADEASGIGRGCWTCADHGVDPARANAQNVGAVPSRPGRGERHPTSSDSEARPEHVSAADGVERLHDVSVWQHQLHALAGRVVSSHSQLWWFVAREVQRVGRVDDDLTAEGLRPRAT